MDPVIGRLKMRWYFNKIALDFESLQQESLEIHNFWKKKNELKKSLLARKTVIDLIEVQLIVLPESMKNYF